MITINLLPTKRKPPKKITELQQQIVLGMLILVLTGIGFLYFWTQLNSRIERLQRDNEAAEARVREQDNMLKEVQTVEEERKKVADKIGVIEQLKKNQSSLVRLLDEVSKALPLGVNLTSLSESSGQVNVEGTAFTNNDIVRFVDNLKASPLLTDVFLLESAQAAQEGVEIYKYKLKLVFKGA
ncbi:MAG TPA: PilN domain-containing protein [Nitrospirota bacterium]|nr:PilN domain-containing protein [Nitrospirota bacterium]